MCGAACRKVAEDDSDDGREGEGDEYNGRIEHEWNFESTSGKAGKSKTQHNPDQAAQAGKYDRFHQELRENLAL